ncbi:U32 family peptidase [candidate division KSB3 bacterium]|uniref:U32 family peptidase n=1 Tax=candidate division KSB3 bacterium TaxID=2044937 RepID=A0A9D5JS94_9BACT|nr:U32 family peptidase [candidate division KSB3 bacterium]MBD3323319.1 U32 family peptidase [candidate division KSB3 bacterium]
MTPQPELILPAGTLEKLQFACAYGADAVYAGLPQVSLRARTNSFTAAQLAEGIQYAHARGVKVFLTANIFARNLRLEPALQSLREVLRFAPDAVILSDPGLLLLARREFPDLEFHLSTQANTMNWAAVQFWHEQGIQRIILPRELSLEEIAAIHARVPSVDLEVFVHGAMCIAYSGRCLLSSYVAHRDANLGVCTNSCRWQYALRTPVLEERQRPGEYFPIQEDDHGTYILNSKDLCAVNHLDALWKAGVRGLKVEGRTKSVYYLAHIGRAYRKALDAIQRGNPLEPSVFEDIHATANRGFTPGFLIRVPEASRQNYELGSSRYTRYKFGAIVRRYDPAQQHAELEVKNRIAVGDTLEFITPHRTWTQQLRQMVDLSGNPLTVAHSGGQNVLISTEQQVEAPFTLVRVPYEP